MPRRRAAFAAGIAALLTLAGCSAGGADSGAAASKLKGWATPVELVWLQDLARWSIGFDGALEQFAELAKDPSNLRGADVGVAEQRLRPVSECSEGLRREVRMAPTPRLARIHDLLGEACEHYGRAADLLLKALRGRGAGARFLLEAKKGQRLQQRALDMLPPGEAQAVPVVGGKSDDTKIDPLYGRVAGDLADEDEAEVRCWSEQDWPRLIQEEQAVTGISVSTNVLGLTGIGSKRINLSPTACRELDRLAYDDEQPEESEARLRLAYGVATLAHEAQHRAGIVEENVAECYGLQRLRDAALSLGADPTYADELATVYWGDYGHVSAEYTSPECRDGGELDLHPATSRWP
jgi:hypothetical protein